MTLVPILILVLAPQSTTVTECVDDSALGVDTGCVYPGPHCDTSGTTPSCRLCTLSEHCDDGDSCTVDFCDNGMCLSGPKMEGAPCDDGYCHEGACWESLGATDDSAAVGPMSSVIVQPLANDRIPGTFLSISLQPQHGTATLTEAGHIAYAPGAHFAGVDWMAYESCTTEGVCDTAKVIFNVASRYDAGAEKETSAHLLAMDDTVHVEPNTRSSIAPLLNDWGFPEETWIASAEQPIHGDVIWTAGAQTLQYRPPTGFIGDDAFSLTVCNAKGECDSSNVTLRVGASPNDAPSVTGQSFQVSKAGETVDVDLLAGAEDFESDTLYVQAVVASAGVQVVLGQFGRAKVTPPSGIATLRYNVCDAHGACTPTTVRFEAPAQLDAPVELKPVPATESRRPRATLEDEPATTATQAPVVNVAGASGDAVGAGCETSGSGPNGWPWALAALVGIALYQRKRGSLAVSKLFLKN